MTGADLKAWRDRLHMTNQQAADRLALTLQGFLDQLYGHRVVSKRTAQLTALVENQEKAP